MQLFVLPHFFGVVIESSQCFLRKGNWTRQQFVQKLHILPTAHLLYFVIKDHPFLDGNKRIGSFLFLLYNRQEGIPEIINENTLTALALLIAESEPANKDLLIRLIVNLIVKEEFL